MRLFPAAVVPATTARRPARSLVALALGGAMLGCVTVPAQSGARADPLTDKKHDVEKHIDRAHDDLDDSSARLRSATAALLRARSDLVRARAHLSRTRQELAVARALDRRMQERLDAAETRLRNARADLADGRADVTDQEGRLRQVVVSTYEQGDPGLMGLSMVLTTQDPAELAGNLNASSSAVNVQTSVLDRLEAAKVLLTVRQQERAAARRQVAVKRRAAARNLRRKRALQQQARAAAQQVSDLVVARGRARGRAVRAKNADLAVLDRLQAERDRIQRMLAARAARAAAQAARSGGSGSGSSGVAQGGGYLGLPVNGPVTSPFGWRIHPIWGYRSLHDGVDFGVGCGTPIRAAASGTVISEYYQTAWGNRIIIDHGSVGGVGLATISNHLSGYAVSVGQHVERGQTVGYVGTTGWSTGCHLHFTVLENGVAVDPMKWF